MATNKVNKDNCDVEAPLKRIFGSACISKLELLRLSGDKFGPFNYDGIEYDFRTDPNKDPISWVNELYQNTKLLTRLHLSNQITFNVISIYDGIISFRMRLTPIRDNKDLNFHEIGDDRKFCQKSLYTKFIKYLYDLNDEELTYGCTRRKADAQMDSTESTTQGMIEAVSDKMVNTIIARDAPIDQAVFLDGLVRKDKIMQELSSAQEIVNFDVLTKRWLQIYHGSFSITDASSDALFYQDFPSFIYSNISAANLLPFKQFVMSSPSISIKIKVNSHKFAQGKYIISYIYDGNKLDDGRMKGMYASIVRPHAFMDLNESNEAQLDIPFKCKTPFIINVTDAEGYETGQFVRVAIHCISPLRVPDESPTTVPYTMFVKFNETNFTGMRYFAEPQMGLEMSKDIITGLKALPIVGSIASGAASSMGSLALALQRPFRSDATMKEVEKNFKYVGLISNRDKPAYIKQPQDLRPINCGSLGDGVGVEPIVPMRLDPTATTIHLPDMDTSNSFKSILEIVRIPGIASVFPWTISDTTQTLLYSREIWPVPLTPTDVVTQQYYTPLEYFSRYFKYYSGSIKFRFDFVCTQFHTGTIMISFIPYNDTYTYDQSRSGYCKMFDLREQKTVEYDVPYIRMTVVDQMPYYSGMPGVGLIPPPPGTLKVWVVNPLTPIQSVSTTIDVIVYISAGDDFQLSYPVSITGDSISDEITYGSPTLTPPTADAQMGEHATTDENDKTDNFNKLVPVGARLQVNEDHMNIKDILRRWRNYATPLTPLEINFLPLIPNGMYSTLQDAIIRNYRWSRGGLVFLLQSLEPGNIYRIYHVPQTSFCFPIGWSSGTRTDLHVYGLASALWDTNVNSTYKIEIPFNGTFVYTDIQALSAGNENRVEVFDRVAYNLGHIALENLSGQTDTIQCLSRVADDFELYNYIGLNLYETTSNYTPTAMNAIKFDMTQQQRLMLSGDVERNPGPTNDDIMLNYMEPGEKLDFRTKVWGGVKNISSNITEPITNTLSAMKGSKIAVESLARASQAWEKSGDTLNSTLEYLKEIAKNITAHVKSSCAWVKNTGHIFSATLHFLHTFISPKWQTFCIAIVGVLTSVGNFFTPIGEKLLDFFSSRTHTSAEQPAEGTSADSQAPSLDESDAVSLCSLIFGSLSGYLGFKGTAPHFGRWARLMKFNDSFWRTITGATKFLENFIQLVNKMFYWLVERIPIAKEYFTLYSKNESICQFISEAQYCLDEINLTQLSDDPSFKYRFWTTTVMAYRLQKILIIKPEKNTAALMRLIQKLLDKSNELAISLTASPVRYEPYVLKISGPTKIGKSFMISETLPQLLSTCFGVRENNPVFTRTPGVEFWNGYKNQKAILYDDYLAVKDPAIAVTQVVELYNLKSTAIMNMNMASINEKQLKGNPYLIALLQNYGFTTLNGTVDPKAFLRRADMHWKCDLAFAFKDKDIKDIPDSVKHVYEHLVFCRYPDPGVEKLDPVLYTYREWRKIVELDMIDYHKRELVNMGRRMKALVRALPDNVRRSLETVDPYSVFYATNNQVAQNLRLIQSGWLPQDMFDSQKNQLRAFIEAHARMMVEVQNQVAHNTDEAREIRRERAQEVDEVEISDSISNLFDDSIEVTPEAILVPTTSGAIIPLTLTPGESAEPQYNMHDAYEGAREILKQILYRPDGPYMREEPYQVEDCLVCFQEREMSAKCINDHQLCFECYERICENGAPICPMCRSDTLGAIYLNTHWWTRLRPIMWTQEVYRLAKGKVKYAYQQPRQALQDLNYWLSLTPNGNRMLSALMSIVYIIYASHSYSRTMRELHECTHSMFETVGISHFKPTQDKKLYGLIDWNKWSVDLCLRDGNGKPITINKDMNTGLAYIAHYNMHNVCDVPRVDPEPYEEPLFYEVGQSQGPTEIVRSKEYKRTLPIKKVIPTGRLECPHLLLHHKMHFNQLLDVSYELDNYDMNGAYGWTVQVEEEQEPLWMYDAPCQYDECWLKDIENRTAFLHCWAIARPDLFNRIRRDWRPPITWPLPEEYLTKPTEVAMQNTRNYVMDQIRTFRTVSWLDKINDCFGEVYRYIKIIGAILSGVAIIMKGYGLCKWLMGYDRKSEAQIISSGEIKTHKLIRKNRLPKKATTAISQSNESQVSASERFVERNTFFIQVNFNVGDQNKVINMRGLGLFGRTGIIPAHYGKYLDKKAKEFELYRITDFRVHVYPFINKEVIIPYPDICQNLAHSDSELCFIKLPPQFCQFKDLTHMIPTVEEHNHIGSTYVHFEPNPALNTILKVPGKIKGVLDTLTINGTDNFEGYDIFDVYCTSYGTLGACGAAYLTDYTKPLFGMHVAGNNSLGQCIGYGIPLVQEDMIAIREGKTLLTTFIPNVATPQASLPGAIIPITTLTKSQTNHLPTKSKIIKSLLDGPLQEHFGPCETSPAILSTKDERWIWDKSPLYWGCIKHTLPPRPFHTDILQDTYDELLPQMIGNMLPVKSVEPLTIEQAITGFDDVPHFDTLDMSTSVGWPWNVGVKKRKDDWIKITRDPISNKIIGVSIDEELILNLTLKDSLRSRGIKPFTVFLDWLKDERRKQNKIEQPNGTRIFSLSPIDFTIQLRQCTLDFSASFMNSRLKINSIVGISPDGLEWSRLANELKMFSPHIITFDYSDFGPRLPADVGFKAMDIIKEWYGEYGKNGFDYGTRLEVMKEELFHAYHLMNDFVYEVFCGAPSGAATTVIHNTLVNILMMRYIWRYIILKENVSYLYLNKFDECVKMFLYGDDGIMSVKEGALEFFNLKNIMIAFQEHDIIITDADKKTSRQRGEPIPNLNEIPRSDILLNSTVLKRGFMPHPFRKGHWLAPIDERSIKETARWCWKSPDHLEATKLNAEQSLNLAFGHGQKYFNRHKNIINSALKSINEQVITLLWNDLDRNFFGTTHILGDFLPDTRLSELFRLSIPSKEVKGLPVTSTLVPNLRREGHGGLKADLVELTDRQMNRFNRTIGGGIIPSALAWDEEENIGIPDYQLRGCGDKGINPLSGIKHKVYVEPKNRENEMAI